MNGAGREILTVLAVGLLAVNPAAPEALPVSGLESG
jgi:hypothetical protein